MSERRDKAFEEWLKGEYPCFSPAGFVSYEEHRKWIETNQKAFNAGWKSRESDQHKGE